MPRPFRRGFSTRGKPKQAPPPRRFFAPTKAPLKPFIEIARSMTIARIARMLDMTPQQAEEEQVRFLRFVEDEAARFPKWRNEIDAWIEYRISLKKQRERAA